MRVAADTSLLVKRHNFYNLTQGKKYYAGKDLILVRLARRICCRPFLKKNENVENYY
jgi:hypothetical protein